MKIEKCEVPESLVKDYVKESNYYDCFYMRLESDILLSPAKFAEKYFIHEEYSWWINILFWLRMFVFRPFCIDGKLHPLKGKKPLSIYKGYQFGPFVVKEITNNEILLFAEAKHLKAYISVYMLNSNQTYEFYFTTCNYYKIRFGKIYFFIIKPFHKWIVKDMMRKYVKDINKNS